MPMETQEHRLLREVVTVQSYQEAPARGRLTVECSCGRLLWAEVALYPLPDLDGLFHEHLAPPSSLEEMRSWGWFEPEETLGIETWSRERLVESALATARERQTTAQGWTRLLHDLGNLGLLNLHHLQRPAGKLPDGQI